MGGKSRAAGVGWNEKVAGDRKDTGETLEPSRRSKALHRPLAPAQRQMRILCSVIQPFVRAVLDFWHDLTLGGRVGAKLVSDHPSWRAALLAQETLQQAFRRFGIASALEDFIEHVAILIHRPPQPVFLARDRDHDFVEMPDVTVAWRLKPKTASESRPELQRPAADGLI